MMITNFMVLASAMFALGVAGVLSNRNFIIMMLSVEMALISSTLLAVSLFYYSSGGNVVPFLIVIWSIASAEAMTMIVFYRYMTRQQISLDVSKLSKLKN